MVWGPGAVWHPPRPRHTWTPAPCGTRPRRWPRAAEYWWQGGGCGWAAGLMAVMAEWCHTRGGASWLVWGAPPLPHLQHHQGRQHAGRGGKASLPRAAPAPGVVGVGALARGTNKRTRHSLGGAQARRCCRCCTRTRQQRRRRRRGSAPGAPCTATLA